MQIWSLVRELGPARWVEKKKILTRNFLFWWCLCLVLAPVWRWLHRMPLGVFPPLQSSGGVWEGLVRFLFMFGRIPQWSHLVLGFCFQGVFFFFFNFINYRFYFISSDWSVQMICFFLIQFWWARNLSISSRLPCLLACNCS